MSAKSHWTSCIFLAAWTTLLVLGCAGLADLCARISADIGVPVVDGVAAATLTVQSLVTMRLTTGKRGEFSAPPPKRYSGLLEGFTTDR